MNNKGSFSRTTIGNFRFIGWAVLLGLLYVQCQKEESSLNPINHHPIEGKWKWQYSLFIWGDSIPSGQYHDKWLYFRNDDSVKTFRHHFSPDTSWTETSYYEIQKVFNGQDSMNMLMLDSVLYGYLLKGDTLMIDKSQTDGPVEYYRKVADP